MKVGSGYIKIHLFNFSCVPFPLAIWWFVNPSIVKYFLSVSEVDISELINCPNYLGHFATSLTISSKNWVSKLKARCENQQEGCSLMKLVEIAIVIKVKKKIVICNPREIIYLFFYSADESYLHHSQKSSVWHIIDILSPTFLCWLSVTLTILYDGVQK